jgi:TolA-binding protein
LTTYRESQYAHEALLRAGVIYVGPLHDMDSGAKMYSTLLERYPHSTTAETAQYHLATLAYWKKDWERALEMYQRVAEAYPNGRYAQLIAMRKVPELMSRLKTSNKTNGDES